MYAGNSIAHDLRSPLTRMRARLEQAIREQGDNPSELSLAMMNDVDELLGIFNSIQRISRLESGEQRSIFQIIDPAPLVEDIADLYEPLCEEEGRNFSHEVQSGLQIKADQGLLAQAISNLVDNAVKYTEAKGGIVLRLRKTGTGNVEISVTDTGPGVPKEQREEILKRFVRLESSRSKQGSGLGLSLVKAIAEIHSAELVIEDGPGSNVGQGKGLRVAIVFPKTRRKSNK
jgi:signal transduction histidine kinase